MIRALTIMFNQTRRSAVRSAGALSLTPSHPLWVSLDTAADCVSRCLISAAGSTRAAHFPSCRHVMSQARLDEELCPPAWLCWSFVKSEEVQNHPSDVIRAISACGQRIHIYNRLYHKRRSCQGEHYGKCSLFFYSYRPPTLNKKGWLGHSVKDMFELCRRDAAHNEFIVPTSRPSPSCLIIPLCTSRGESRKPASCRHFLEVIRLRI